MGDRKKTKVFVISDVHLPFHNNHALQKVYKLIEKEQPTHVVQIGDLVDQYAFSNYPKSMKVPPKDTEKGLKQAQEMWKKIHTLVPKAKLYQLLGNHDMRMSKRISEKLPALAPFFDLKKMYTFDNVKTMETDRSFLQIDGVIYVHGWFSKSEDHSKYFNKPCVHGHRHKPTIVYTSSNLWSMDVGYMADGKSLPLSYTASDYSKWTLACGIVENRVPRIIKL
jgi:predicted phosphodiesterase